MRKVRETKIFRKLFKSESKRYSQFLERFKNNRDFRICQNAGVNFTLKDTKNSIVVVSEREGVVCEKDTNTLDILEIPSYIFPHIFYELVFRLEVTKVFKDNLADWGVTCGGYRDSKEFLYFKFKSKEPILIEQQGAIKRFAGDPFDNSESREFFQLPCDKDYISENLEDFKQTLRDIFEMRERKLEKCEISS